MDSFHSEGKFLSVWVKCPVVPLDMCIMFFFNSWFKFLEGALTSVIQGWGWGGLCIPLISSSFFLIFQSAYPPCLSFKCCLQCVWSALESCGVQTNNWRTNLVVVCNCYSCLPVLSAFVEVVCKGTVITGNRQVKQKCSRSFMLLKLFWSATRQILALLHLICCWIINEMLTEIVLFLCVVWIERNWRRIEGYSQTGPGEENWRKRSAIYNGKYMNLILCTWTYPYWCLWPLSWQFAVSTLLRNVCSQTSSKKTSSSDNHLLTISIFSCRRLLT